jgi:hypothetical protein
MNGLAQQRGTVAKARKQLRSGNRACKFTENPNTKTVTQTLALDAALEALHVVVHFASLGGHG